VAERSNAADCKSALYEFDGSNPSPTTILSQYLAVLAFFWGMECKCQMISIAKASGFVEDVGHEKTA
ncbi:MAG: hypothetical protein JXR23_01140, partial [Pontiellaceae bacterium]|nr:hypothetical protein [Pontiellaceae bacterium]